MVQRPEEKPQIVGRRCVPSDYSPTWLTATKMEVERRASQSLSPCVGRCESLSPRAGRRATTTPEDAGKTTPVRQVRGRNRVNVDVLPSRATPLLYVTSDSADSVSSSSSSSSSLSSDDSNSPLARKDNQDTGLPSGLSLRPASLLRRRSLPIVHDPEVDLPDRTEETTGRPRSSSIVGGQCFRNRNTALTPVAKKAGAKKTKNKDTSGKPKPTPVARPNGGRLAGVTLPVVDSKLRSILKGSTTNAPGRSTSPGHVSFNDGSRPGPTARHGRRASIATENALLLPPGYFTPREAKQSVSSSEAFLEAMAEYKEEQQPRRRNSTPDVNVSLFPLDLSSESANDTTHNAVEFRLDTNFAERDDDDAGGSSRRDVIGSDDIRADRGVTSDGGVWSIVHSWTPRRGLLNRKQV